MARLSLYDTHVKPNLHIIRGWSRKGVTHEEMAKNLNINYSTFRDYKDKHPQLATVLKTSRKVANTEVENALFKKACGYDYEEVREEYENGQLVRKIVTKKHVQPSESAIIFWLKNRAPDEWQNNDKIEISSKDDNDAIRDLTNTLLKRDFRKLEVVDQNNNNNNQKESD